jgi:hypothetical protein
MLYRTPPEPNGVGMICLSKMKEQEALRMSNRKHHFTTLA